MKTSFLMFQRHLSVSWSMWFHVHVDSSCTEGGWSLVGELNSHTPKAGGGGGAKSDLFKTHTHHLGC